MVIGDLKDIYTVTEGYVGSPSLPKELIKAVWCQAGRQSALMGYYFRTFCDCPCAVSITQQAGRKQITKGNLY